VKTPHLVAGTLAALAVLAFAPAVPVLSPALCLVALPALGDLWLRALTGEPLTPVARVGLGVVAGLVSLPLTALALYIGGLRIERHQLAAGLAVLTIVLATWERVAWRRVWRRAGGPHPLHWVGTPEHPGTTRTQRLSTIAAVGVPAVLALLIGGAATVAYQRLPHPAEPGFTSLALAGWAAGITGPVAFPLDGLRVPLEVNSAGEPTRTATLQVLIGDRAAGRGVPVLITGGTHPLRVHVPSPTDGCLQPIRISLGAASTVFYGRGPFPARRGAVPC
jgi:hypothetical protein